MQVSFVRALGRARQFPWEEVSICTTLTIPTPEGFLWNTGRKLTTTIDNPLQHGHSNVRPEPPICPLQSQSSLRPSSSLQQSILVSTTTHAPNPSLTNTIFAQRANASKASKEGKRRSKKLTSQPHIPPNNLQILRPPQLRTKLTTPPHNILAEFFIPIRAPIAVLATPAENHAAAERPGEDVGSRRIDACGGAEVPVSSECQYRSGSMKNQNRRKGGWVGFVYGARFKM